MGLTLNSSQYVQLLWLLLSSASNAAAFLDMTLILLPDFFHTAISYLGAVPSLKLQLVHIMILTWKAVTTS